MSNKKFSTCLLTIFLKHSLTYTCLSDITSLSCLLWHYLFQTQFFTQNICSSINSSIMKALCTVAHRYCNFCSQLLLAGSKCSRAECVVAKACVATFVQVLIDKLQICFKVSWSRMAMPAIKITKYYSQTHFLQQLLYHFEHQHTEGHLSGIYDGKVCGDTSAFFVVVTMCHSPSVTMVHQSLSHQIICRFTATHQWTTTDFKVIKCVLILTIDNQFLYVCILCYIP